MFQSEQDPFPFGAGSESAESVFGGNSMTGDKEWEWVCPAGSTDGANGFWVIDLCGDLSIAPCFSAGNGV